MNENNFDQMNREPAHTGTTSQFGQPMGNPMPQQPMNNMPMQEPVPVPANNNMAQPMGNPMPQQPMNNSFNQPVQNPMPMDNNMNQPMGQPMNNYNQPMNNNFNQPMNNNYQQPVMNEPVNNYQQPMYNTPKPVIQKTNNNGFIIGVVFLLLIVGVVLLIVLKPFDKTYEGTTNTTNTTNTNNNTNNNSNTNNGGSSSSTPPATSKIYTCSNSKIQDGVDFGMTVTLYDNPGAVEGTKMDLNYSYSKVNGQAYTTAEKDAITKNVETNLTTSYKEIGTVGAVKSSLSGGKLYVTASAILLHLYPEDVASGFESEGFICR